MIKRNGKTYVVLEFDDEADAAYFEMSFNDQVRNDLHEAAMHGRLGDVAFAALDEVNITNNSSGPVHGVLNQIGVVGKRVQ